MRKQLSNTRQILLANSRNKIPQSPWSDYFIIYDYNNSLQVVAIKDWGSTFTELCLLTTRLHTTGYPRQPLEGIHLLQGINVGKLLTDFNETSIISRMFIHNNCIQMLARL